jgi:hypothetical protein
VRVGEQRGGSCASCIQHAMHLGFRKPLFLVKKVGFFILTLRGGLVAWG